MSEDPIPSAPKRPSFAARLADVARRLEQTKVTIWTVIAFIGVLALMSALAASVGYVTHAMRH